MKKIITIMGPTASGKTDLAIALHERLPVDIISVDSALVYRGMDIGTGKPSKEILQVTPHRLIDLCDPSQVYSSGQFCIEATLEIQQIRQHHRQPLLVGGTMLYFRELLLGTAPLPKANADIREALEKEAQRIGWEAMHKKLQAIDPEAASKIKPQDPQRIERALEVFLITGEKISVLQQNRTPVFLESEIMQIALIPEDRAWLHHRIAQRFEKMLAEGLVDEVQHLKNRGDLTKDLPSMRMVGYRQVWEYLEGLDDFDAMKAKAIAATRQLAKRQLTWLRSWENLRVFDPQDPHLIEKVLQCLL